ncbi:uncharacterized protein EAF01_006889 [Botrytis porri]|uniref:uncharacterized protein n=1 Tax=Botrytis porri TaxID=87229 RepID=UPI001902B575|nr:uncharacterized protein EAF01_006889 [Botrytis porri]KAF7901590.1 hypothetical protein EAF01_006889 [Botrytis porri]
MLPFIVTDDLPLHILHIRFRFATGERKSSSLNTPQTSDHGKTILITMTITITHTDIAKLELFQP